MLDHSLFHNGLIVKNQFCSTTFLPNVQQANVDSICLTADLFGNIIDATHNINAKNILNINSKIPNGRYKRNCNTLSPINLKIKISHFLPFASFWLMVDPAGLLWFCLISLVLKTFLFLHSCNCLSYDRVLKITKIEQ